MLTSNASEVAHILKQIEQEYQASKQRLERPEQSISIIANTIWKSIDQGVSHPMKKIGLDTLTTGQHIDRSSPSLKLNGPGVRRMKRRETICMSHYDQPKIV